MNIRKSVGVEDVGLLLHVVAGELDLVTLLGNTERLVLHQNRLFLLLAHLRHWHVTLMLHLPHVVFHGHH